ncbi:MAG: hypothetical protein HY811_10355, partial [Planctomycetes bacterium]|nr:hypothetical protein [Planctomycetota bacterium]
MKNRSLVIWICLIIVWSLVIGNLCNFAYGDSWSETVFTNTGSSFSNTVTTTGSAEVNLLSTSLNAVTITAGVSSNYTLGVFSDNKLRSWGHNMTGQLGLGDAIQRNSPVQVGADSWKAIASSGDPYLLGQIYGHSAGIKTDNTLWTWGCNMYGQLGLGDTNQRNSPVQVGANTWKAVACGNHYTLAIRSDDTLWAWGYNGFGNLGDGTTTQRNSPVQIGASTWKAIACGGYHTLGIRSDNTLWAWGANDYGQLGLNDTTPRSSPVQVGASTWQIISAGGTHSLAIRSDNTLWAWGYNGFGEVGDGTTTQRNSPVQVGASTWKTVSAGGHRGTFYVGYSIGIRSDDTLWSWGSNNNGQLGLGDTTNRLSPVQVGTDANWKTVVCSWAHTMAAKTTGSLWAWGYNFYGQLGLGDTVNRNSPVQVPLSAYVAGGNYVSPLITFINATWGVLTYTVTSPTNTTATVDVLKGSDNSLLVANVPSGTNLSLTYPATFTGITGIKLRVNMATTNASQTPLLSDWTVGWDGPKVQTSAWTMLTNGNTPVKMGESIAYVKFNANTISGTARWKKFRIDKGVTGVATPCPDNKIEVQIWMEN